MYKAHYIHRTEPLSYYRTITGADSLNDAVRQAERFTRKGYICHTVMEVEGSL